MSEKLIAKIRVQTIADFFISVAQGSLIEDSRLFEVRKNNLA